jgi:hypothetical protein
LPKKKLSNKISNILPNMKSKMSSNKTLKEMFQIVKNMPPVHLDVLLSSSNNATALQVTSSTTVTSMLTMEAIMFLHTLRCSIILIFQLLLHKVHLDSNARNINHLPIIRNNVSVLLRNTDDWFCNIENQNKTISKINCNNTFH